MIALPVRLCASNASMIQAGCQGLAIWLLKASAGRYTDWALQRNSQPGLPHTLQDHQAGSLTQGVVLLRLSTAKPPSVPRASFVGEDCRMSCATSSARQRRTRSPVQPAALVTASARGLGPSIQNKDAKCRIPSL